jgi:hypothetical protein
LTRTGTILSPTDPESQRESLNKLARETKLVTIGKDSDALRRLCHIGYSPEQAGRRAARFILEKIAANARIALIAATTTGNPRSAEIQARLAGFKQQWHELGGDSTSTLTEIGLFGADGRGAVTALERMLGNQEWTYLVALDDTSAEAAIAVSTASSHISLPAVFALDPTPSVLGAIDAGRNVYAVYDDPYFSGYEAVRRLADYCRSSTDALPAPGHGEVCLFGEVVHRENMAQIRQRSPIVTAFARQSPSGDLEQNRADNFSFDRVARRIANFAESFAGSQAAGN